MNYIGYNLFPGGRPKALTFSYDDGTIHDRRLVEIFNQYGMKASFHLNSKNLGSTEQFIAANEVKRLFDGHEVSAHCVHHPFLDNQPDVQIAAEIREDCAALEKLAGYPVRGMSYPYGAYNTRVADVLRNTGMKYSRTVKSTEWFDLPEDFMKWHATCHHRHITDELIDRFMNLEAGHLRKGLMLFYVWGHSYEFDRDDNWDHIERFCKRMACKADIWYATNIEIYDYVTALHRLDFSMERDMVFNPTSQELWFTFNNAVVSVKPGETKPLVSS